MTYAFNELEVNGEKLYRVIPQYKRHPILGYKKSKEEAIAEYEAFTKERGIENTYTNEVQS